MSAEMFTVLAQRSRNDRSKNSGRKDRLDISGESRSGHTAKQRAHELYCSHERIREWHRPKHIETELRAGLRVGGNAARIVVGDTRDDARPDPCEGVLLKARP